MLSLATLIMVGHSVQFIDVNMCCSLAGTQFVGFRPKLHSGGTLALLSKGESTANVSVALLISSMGSLYKFDARYVCHIQEWDDGTDLC